MGVIGCLEVESLRAQASACPPPTLSRGQNVNPVHVTPECHCPAHVLRSLTSLIYEVGQLTYATGWWCG